MTAMFPVAEPVIDRTTLRLEPTRDYFAEAKLKTTVVLHHTVGGSASSTHKWWRDDPRRVGTAYLVERDGRIFETFPPDCWAWHVNAKAQDLEERTIGIELCSEGALQALQDQANPGRTLLFGLNGTRNLGDAAVALEQGRAVYFEEGWRGYQWFDAYDLRQFNAAAALITWLCQQFRILPRIPLEAPHAEADARRWYAQGGVLHHAMYRPDKSDLHPAFPWVELAHWLGDERWPADA